MREIHPNEIDLAQFSELDGKETKEMSVEVAEHLRWCARCRSTVADHRWLQQEVAATLAAAADTVPVPRLKWWAVQEVLFTSQRRQATGWRVSAIASVVLAACLMLLVSPVLGTAAVVAQTARMSFPEAKVAIAPFANAVSGEYSTSISTSVSSSSISMATPTPAIFRKVRETAPLPTPILVLPPTPPQQPETRDPRL